MQAVLVFARPLSVEDAGLVTRTPDHEPIGQPLGPCCPPHLQQSCFQHVPHLKSMLVFNVVTDQDYVSRLCTSSDTYG